MSAPIPPVTGPIRVGLLGCGRISKNHLDAIAKVKELELVAVADTDLARAQAVGERAACRPSARSRRCLPTCRAIS